MRRNPRLQERLPATSLGSAAGCLIRRALPRLALLLRVQQQGSSNGEATSLLAGIRSWQSTSERMQMPQGRPRGGHAATLGPVVVPLVPFSGTELFPLVPQAALADCPEAEDDET